METTMAARPNDIQLVDQSAVTDYADEGMFSDRRLELIRRQVANGAPEDLFRAMIEIARVRGLDPLAKQISLIKFGNQWQITTTIDGYRAIAESTGAYAGSDEPVFGPATITLRTGRAVPEWAAVTVWKMVHGQRVPFTAKVFWEEYTGDNHTWNKMPRTMLAKVAESHALRKAFPKVLSGMYTGDEMDQASVEATARVVDRETGEIRPRAAIAPAADWDGASKLLHATAAEYGISHDDLHNWAEDRRFGSVKNATEEAMRNLAKDIRQRPADAQRYFAGLRKPAASDLVEVEHRPVNTAPATMDEVEAALDASTPASAELPGLSGTPTSGSERFLN